MTSVEQKKMVDDLRYYSRWMDRTDLDDFEMFSKRIKDDEDLDIQAQQHLLKLFDQHSKIKSKRSVKNPFEK